MSNLEWCTHKYNSNYGTAIERAKKNARPYIDEKRSKPVWQYSSDGSFMMEYCSITSASSKTGIDVSMISRVCKGRCVLAGGYIWRFAIRGEAPTDVPPVIRMQYSHKDGKKLYMSLRAEPVVQYSKDGLFIKQYASAEEADRLLSGLAHKGQSIHSACNKSKKTAYGYYWFYKRDVVDGRGEVLQKVSVDRFKSHSKHPVGQFDKNGIFIRRFESCADAARHIGAAPCSVSAACSDHCGPRTLHGFIWKHVE